MLSVPAANSWCCHCRATGSGLSPWKRDTLGQGELEEGDTPPSTQVPASPHSPDPTQRPATADSKGHPPSINEGVTL